MILVIYFLVVIAAVGAAAIASQFTGNWWLLGGMVAFLASCTAIMVVLINGPAFIIWLRGYRNTNDSWRDKRQGDWKTAFGPRSHIECMMVYSVMSQVIPKPSIDIYEWLGADARRVFTGIEEASRREAGGRFRVSQQLLDIRDADIQDFDMLLGYFEVASIDASIYAVKDNMPIDYAKAMFP